MDSTEQRIDKLEAREMATSLILRGLVTRIFQGAPDDLALLRGAVCSAIEGLYDNPVVAERTHIMLQTAVDLAETVLAPTQPQSGPDRRNS
jgi:hypothetical protein